MPRSVSVSSSAQSSTTTAMFAILALNFFGRRRSAFSTSPSNCRRVMSGACPLEPSDALDVDDVSDFADGRHDVLELRSEEHTSELQSQSNLVCRLLLEKKKKITYNNC